MARIPESIGKYKITAEIARGGMGAVYKAVHPTLKRNVILKKLTLRGSATVTERFKREARIMMDFKNDLIVNVYDHFRQGSSYYIVLEYVDGTALDRLIRRERYLPNDITLLIFRDCCRALKYAHSKNVIHRDIKPGNILLSKTGEVKLVDFGIAVSMDEEAGLTRDGVTLGTPSYMAPEQFESTKSVDKRADVYSMGVMLYEMVTGKKPFPGNFSPETLALIQKGKFKPVRRVNPKALPLIARIIKKSMHFKPERRYKDIDSLLKLLDKHFKRFSAASARKRLRSAVNGEELKPQGKKENSPRGKLVFALILIIAAVLGTGSWYLYRQGYYHEYIRSKEYGALIISAKVRKGFKTPSDTYADARLFLDDGDKIPEVEVEILLKENKLLETESYITLVSQKLYLEPGFYRLKVNLENRLFWSNFYLNARNAQKEAPATADAFKIETILDSMPSLPLIVKYTVTDQINGLNLKERTKMFFSTGSKWSEWSEKLSKKLVTGKVYRFKFTCPDYNPQVYSLRIAPFQTVLDLSVSLVPITSSP